VEITAAYREPRIKTYGFQRKTDLVLFELSAKSEDLAALGRSLCRLGEEGVDFHLTFGQGWDGRTCRVYLLIGREREGIVAEHFRALAGSQSPLCGRALGPADLVFFQGPHFGDRFGILDTALQALTVKGLRTIAAACSLSCIYLVVPEGMSQDVVSALSEVFDIPKPPRTLTRRPSLNLRED
jgi:hypothetical protein